MYLLRATPMLVIRMSIVLVTIACRGDVEPFRPDALVFRGGGRLTYNLGDDRSPAWMTSGDGILYTTDGLVGIDSGPGLLVRISLSDGRSLPALPEIQSPTVTERHWLSGPTPRPDGDALAFAEILDVWEPHSCDTLLTFLRCAPPRTLEEAKRPPLRRIAIRVRESGAAGSPAGDRLAFSDGLRIRIWTPGEESAEPVPGTDEGVWPAWSPDGEWIALTRLERGDSIGASCDDIGIGIPVVLCVQERREFTIGASMLALVRRDGSDLRIPGEGGRAGLVAGRSNPLLHAGGASLAYAGGRGRAATDTEHGHRTRAGDLP